MFIKEVTLPKLSARTSVTFLQALALSGGEILTTYSSSNGFPSTKPSHHSLTFTLSFSSAYRLLKFTELCDGILEIEEVESVRGA